MVSSVKDILRDDISLRLLDGTFRPIPIGIRHNGIIRYVRSALTISIRSPTLAANISDETALTLPITPP